MSGPFVVDGQVYQSVEDLYAHHRQIAQDINARQRARNQSLRAAVQARDVAALTGRDPDDVIVRIQLAEALAQAGDPELYRQLRDHYPPVIHHCWAGEVIRLSAPQWQACLEAINPSVTWFSALRGQVVGQVRIRSLLGLAAYLRRSDVVRWLLVRGAPVMEENLGNAQNSQVKVLLLRAAPEAAGWMKPADWATFTLLNGRLLWAALSLPAELAARHIGPAVARSREVIRVSLQVALPAADLVNYVLRAL